MNIKKQNETTSDWMFKKWMHKSYAIFNSLRKVVNIGTLMVAYFTILGYGQTFAQTDTASIEKKINLKEVEVSAHRTPALYSEVGRVITVISKKEIEALPVQSVDQLLEYIANVDVRQRGPLGVQSDVSIRGGSSDEVMILLNGINITDPQSGHHSLNLPIDFHSIERVEVLEGPGARIYGANAFSGAINFITGSEDASSVKVNALGGAYGLYDGGVSATLAGKKVKSFVAVNKSHSDGYIDNTDFDIYNLFYQGKLNIKDQSVELQVGYNNKGFGANEFYSAKYPDQYEHTKTTFASLKFKTHTDNPFESSIYWRRHQDRFELYRGMVDAPSWYTTFNYHLTNIVGANINKVIKSKIGKTAIGADFRSESIWSNVLGLDMDDSIAVPGEGGVYFDKTYTRTNSSLFLEHSYTFQKFSVSAGVLFNSNSDLDWKFDVFPGIDVSYWLNNNMKIYASYNKTLRMPTFTDLFYSGTTNVGNPDLEPEEASTIEGGIKYNSGNGFHANLSSFYRHGKNMIDWGREAGTDSKYTASNLNDLNTTGVEAAFDLNFQRILPNQLFLKTFNVNYSWLNQAESLPEGYESMYVYDYLKHKFSANFQHLVISHINASWGCSFQDRVGSYDEYNINDGTTETKDYKPFWVLDFRLTWKNKNKMVYVEATNLLDKKYTDLGQLYQPGRWIKAGLKYKFSL